MNKKLITLGITSFVTFSTIITSFATDVVTVRFVDKTQYTKTVVIRCGEYEGKSGKRIGISDELTLDQNKYPINNDKTLSEFYINKQIAESIANNLRQVNPNLNVVTQYAKSSWSDLNMAGKLALAQNDNVVMYLSIHNNAHDNSDTNGYMFLTGENSTYENNMVAERLSNSIQSNGMVTQRKNAYNVDYIGELNETTGKCISVLGEFGFFTNNKDLQNITSEEYVNYVGENLANEINNIVEEN